MTSYEGIDIANDNIYGLSSAVYAKNDESALAIARCIRAGQCYINGAGFSYDAPFGGYKQSGNGRSGVTRGLKSLLKLNLS